MAHETIDTNTGDAVPEAPANRLPELSADLVHADILGCHVLKNRVDLGGRMGGSRPPETGGTGARGLRRTREAATRPPDGPDRAQDRRFPDSSRRSGARTPCRARAAPGITGIPGTSRSSARSPWEPARTGGTAPAAGRRRGRGTGGAGSRR